MARWQHFSVVTRGKKPVPNDAVRREIACQIEDRCTAHGLTPVDLVAAESWRLHGGNMLYRLTIDMEPGTPKISALRWLAWKHPAWNWSPLPCPRGEGLPPPPAYGDRLLTALLREHGAS